MALPTAYLVTPKNLTGIINALISAKAPDKLTVQFLKSLGFTSSNDSLYIKLFREIGLIDSTGVPTEKYYRFIDQSETKKVLAECIEDGYSDLFALNKKAYELSEVDVKNKLKTLTQGQKEENILSLMAKTFKALCDHAEFSKEKKSSPIIEKKPEDLRTDPPKDEDQFKEKKIKPSLHYNIEIHLPETRDQAVYDAIFKSFKDHLL
jgi:hypothetical protein